MWYSCQNIFKFFTILSFLLCINYPLFTQNNDSISSTNKFSLAEKNTEEGMWDFEKDDDFNLAKNKTKAVKNEIDISQLHCTKNVVFSKKNTKLNIPYNHINSYAVSERNYFKTLQTQKDIVSLQFGIGFSLYQLNLGRNKAIIDDDTITFAYSNQEVTKNYLRYNYLTIPLKFNFKPFPLKQDKLQLSLALHYNYALSGKYQFSYNENGFTKKEIITGKLHQKPQFITSRGQVTYKNFGVFFESSLNAVFSIFHEPFFHRFGIVICNY